MVHELFSAAAVIIGCVLVTKVLNVSRPLPSIALCVGIGLIAMGATS